MATITPATAVIAGATITRAASAPAGDVVPYAGGDLLLHFANGHDSSITVSVAPTQATGILQGAGTVTIPTRSIAVAAGAEAAMLFKADEISAYLNSSRQVPISYASGDTDLTVMALTV